jgi:hypothetical protein
MPGSALSYAVAQTPLLHVPIGHFVQVCPRVQTLPQLPQLYGSLEVSTQVPPHIVPSHVEVQVPPEQTPEGQTLPHDPQLLGSLLV